jgi:hypothetical protein
LLKRNGLNFEQFCNLLCNDLRIAPDVILENYNVNLEASTNREQLNKLFLRAVDSIEKNKELK